MFKMSIFNKYNVNTVIVTQSLDTENSILLYYYGCYIITKSIVDNYVTVSWLQLLL